MQTFKTDHDAVFWTADDGEWVPAHVARGLYECLKAVLDDDACQKIPFEIWDKADDALAMADKGE